MRSPPTTATTAVPATGPGRAAAGRAGSCRRRRGRSSPTAWRSPAGLAPLIDRIDGELHARAKADPRVKVLRTLPGVGEFTALVMLAEIGGITRFPQCPQAGQLGRADPDRARPGA
jgi:transposase